jgi:hypothetical protein
MRWAAAAIASSSETSLPLTMGFAGGSTRSKPAVDRGQPFFRTYKVVPVRAISISSHKRPQKGHVTFS